MSSCYIPCDSDDIIGDVLEFANFCVADGTEIG